MMRPELHEPCDACGGLCMVCVACDEVIAEPDQVEYLPAPGTREPEPVCVACWSDAQELVA